MDQKLLQALNNVGFALESLTEAIQSNQDAKSSTAEAIKSGNFGKQLDRKLNKFLKTKKL